MAGLREGAFRAFLHGVQALDRARLRARTFSAGDTVLFWHTGGQPGYFA